VSALGCALVLPAGCGAAASDASSDASGSGGSASDSTAPDSLEFEPRSLLTLAPGETRELFVRAVPSGEYVVDFALLGDAENASLDRSQYLTSTDGTATVMLTAPTGARAVTTFTVRASVGPAVRAEMAVSVSEAGFATLRIEPNYGGTRPVDSWVASVRTGTDCASLPSGPLPEADLSAASADGESAPVIDDVPVGGVVAVTLRAGFYASGCADVLELIADHENVIQVPVTDVPLRLDQTELDVALDVQEPPPESDWSAWIGPLAEETAQALAAETDDDVAALLDAMQASTTDADDADAFAEARTAQSWDTQLAVFWGDDTAERALRDVVVEWMQAGAAELPQEMLFGTLSPAGALPGEAWLSLGRFAGVDAVQAGFSVDNRVSWNAEPDDTVLLGATLSWRPSRWLTAAALPAAQQDVPRAETVPGALAVAVDCEGLATALAEATEPLDSVYADCDVTCTARLCEAALDELWLEARTASTAWSTLSLTAVGAASVDEAAHPASFEGTWLGEIESTTISLGGPAHGAASAATQ
jgi:hypothetical protein